MGDEEEEALPVDAEAERIQDALMATSASSARAAGPLVRPGSSRPGATATAPEAWDSEEAEPAVEVDAPPGTAGTLSRSGSRGGAPPSTSRRNSLRDGMNPRPLSRSGSQSGRGSAQGSARAAPSGSMRTPRPGGNDSGGTSTYDSAQPATPMEAHAVDPEPIADFPESSDVAAEPVIAPVVADGYMVPEFVRSLSSRGAGGSREAAFGTVAEEDDPGLDTRARSGGGVPRGPKAGKLRGLQLTLATVRLDATDVLTRTGGRLPRKLLLPALTGRLQFQQPMTAARLAQRHAAAAASVAATKAHLRAVVDARPALKPARYSTILDGFLLVAAAGAELPEEVEAASVAGRELAGIESRDMPYFSRLAVLDAGDNELPGIAPFAGLASLRDLRLQCNCLGPGLDVPLAPAFARLTTLDLSFNMLAAAALVGLARLPVLRTLDLTCNEVRAVPAAVAAPGAFPRLEALALGSNGLGDASLSLLAFIPHLRVLLVPGNAIAAAPPAMASGPYFPQLQALDLASNRVASAEALAPLSAAPQLARVILWGNPLCSAARAADSTLANGITSLLVMAPAPRAKPNVADLYDLAPPSAVDSSLALGMGTSSDGQAMGDQLAEVFERLDDAIAAAHFRGDSGILEPLHEGESEDAATVGPSSPDDGAAPPPQPPRESGGATLDMQWLEEDDDNRAGIFLTALQGHGGGGVPGAGPYDDLPRLETFDEFMESARQAALSGAGDRARGLGGGESALAALKFALAHPLVDEPEALRVNGPPTKHQQPTQASARRAQQQISDLNQARANRAAAKALLVTAPPLPPPLPPVDSTRYQVANVENILVSMRERLHAIEQTLLASNGETGGRFVPAVEGLS